MTTTTDALANPVTGKPATAESNRVVFSDPYTAEVTAVLDLGASRGAAQAPVFSSAY